MSGVESALTASLVREYLSRKGLKGTLQSLDEEMPRTEESISNRVQLAKEMHIEKLMKKNKELPEPFRTMLEVIVRFMRELGAGQTSRSVQGAVSQANSSVKAKSSSKREKKLLHSDHARRDHGEPTSPEQNDYDDLLGKSNTDSRKEKLRKDNFKHETRRKGGHSQHDEYDNLLRKLDEDSGSLKEKPKMDSVKHERKGIGEESRLKLHAQRSDSQELPTKANSGKDTKTQRSKLRSLGGPIVSSGLAGVRNGRTSRHGGGRTSQSLSVGKRNFFDEDADLLGSTQLEHNRNKSLESENKTETAEIVARDSFTIEGADFSPKPSRMTAQHKNTRSWAGPSSKSQEKHNDELVFEDVDEDLDQDIGQLSLAPNKALLVDYESKPISLEIAMSLKNLIFGSATTTFTREWRQQSFCFCDIHRLEFGIVQLKGGPCGVLAAVQAIVLKHLLFADKRPITEAKRKLQPSPRERSRALVSALTEILWRAGNNKAAMVTLPTGTSNFIGAGRYKPDQLTETLVLYTFDSKESLQAFLSQHVSQFESKSSSGCILLLYSVILSRSVKRVISDMDDPGNRLMGAHGYCAQEMVNVITTGKAVSNVFDNIMELDSGGSTKCVLKGVAKQADVGLLSLFEHYGSCQVGANLKSPKFPIWVVCSESHFSVLFSVDRNLLDDWKLGKQFDLYYYDGLARQDEEIRITVDTTKECAEYKDGDLLPPLELCIRTRWKRAVIDWNGTEPIL